RPVTTASGDASFALSEDAFGGGAIHLAWESEHYDHAKLQALLREWIYRDQGLVDLARPALWSSLGVLVVGLLVGIRQDMNRARARKHGRRLKGPELVSVRAFNRRLRADGIGFARVSR